MATQPILSRSTSLMQSNLMLSRLRKTDAALFDAQRQISTGLKQAVPSDDPSNTSAILKLREQLAAREQYEKNLQHASSVLTSTDQALGEATNILIDSQTLASSMVNASSQEREAEALVVEAQSKGLLDLANRQLDGVSLFGGATGATDGGLVFEEFLGGIRYTGADDNLYADTGLLESHAFTSNGVEAFGALSTRVKSQVDLNPDTTPETYINDIDGVYNVGVSKGEVTISVDGTVLNLDLSDVNTLGDVELRINEAIDSVNPAAGAIAIGPNTFELTNKPGHTIVIDDIGNGRVGADLGIDLAATNPGGATAFGGDLHPRLTLTTPLSAFKVGVDWSSGLVITQGEQTKTADFSSAENVQDLVNEVKRLGLGLRLQINDQQNGLDLVSEVSGLELSVGENGGTTAEDLGIRTLGRSTALSDFRHGLGIEPVSGQDDFEITLHNGVSFGVDASGVTDVGELVTAIQDSATAAGVNVGTDFTVDLASVGNGFVFQDNTGGPGGFTITRAGKSVVADQLGILKEDGAASTFTSSDEAKVRVENVFTHLKDLQDSLLADDTLGITIATSKLEVDNRNVIQARATVGVRSKRVDAQQQRSEDLKVTEKSLLSDLQDADLTEVITRFSQLQTQLQASLQVGAQNLQLSLLDFLR